jgi:hypothetical protein
MLLRQHRNRHNRTDCFCKTNIVVTVIEIYYGGNILMKISRGTPTSFYLKRCKLSFLETNHVSLLTSEITQRYFVNNATVVLRKKMIYTALLSRHNDWLFSLSI